MNIEDLTLKEIRELTKIFNLGETKTSNEIHSYEIGKAYYIRTVTMHIIGKLEKVHEKELVLSEASWIAESGRFYNALKFGVDKLGEVEPFPAEQQVIVGRGALIDATIWCHDLPRTQK